MNHGTTAILRIDPEFKALIPPLSPDERDQLESNIKLDGCRDPLVVWQDDILLDGHNRYDICQAHGIPFDISKLALASRDEAKVWIIRNQFGRRNLAPYQRAELALKLEPLISEKSRAKQKSEGKALGGTLKQKSAEGSVETRKEIARIAGVSHDTIHKAKTIHEKASAPIKERLRRGETTINREYKAIVQAERKADQIRAVESADLPDGKYHVVVADPPWAYSNRASDSEHRAANPYPSMSIDQVKAMPVTSISNDDCILWLWTTNAFMVEAHDVAKAWGFTVKTILTWAKDRMGTGEWLRGKTEHCLMCVRGKPVITLTNQTTLLEGPMREHSRKPEEFYVMVDALCHGSKCELFSRTKREGWTAAGAEIGKFVV